MYTLIYGENLKCTLFYHIFGTKIKRKIVFFQIERRKSKVYFISSPVLRAAFVPLTPAGSFLSLQTPFQVI